MACSEWGPMRENNIQWMLIFWVLMQQSKGQFWCFRETYYLPPFSRWQPSSGACCCNMEEGMCNTAQLGGILANQSYRRGEEVGLVPSHIYPQLTNWMPYTHIKITNVTKTFHPKNTIKPLCLSLFNKYLMSVFPTLKNMGNLLAHASKHHLQKFPQSLHCCILTSWNVW